MRKATLTALMILLTLTISARAQSDPVTDEMLKNGFFGTGTYTGNAEYSVNLYNGNLIAGIPLVTLPGRAGHDLRLSMSYNSKQLVRYEENYYGTSYWYGRFFQEGATSGRWLVSSWPTLQYEAGPCYYFTSPDGAVHKLDRAEGPLLYASDGSGMRYAPGPRVEQLDGSYFDFSIAGRVDHVDRNGNRITYETSGQTRKITDTLGREVLIYCEPEPHNSYWNQRVHQIVVKNHQGADLVWTFGYATKTISPYLMVYDGCIAWGCSWDYDHGHSHGPYYGVNQGFNYAGPYGAVSVLTSLTLPNGTSYQFTYNDDVVNGCPGSPPLTLSTLQLTSMTYPTGARIDVGYAPPFSTFFECGHVSRGYDQRLAHLVSSVTLNPGGGTPQLTTYDYTYDSCSNVTQTIENRPDGSKKVVTWNPAGSGDQFLRNTEYVKDTNGTTVLQRVATGWTTTTSGKYVGFTETGYYDNGAEVRTSRVNQSYDSWGNAIETSLSECPYEWCTGLYRTRTTRQFQVGPYPYVTKLMKEETWRTTDKIVSSTLYVYDEYGLTDRGTVTQQLPGYGPGNPVRGNVTRVRRFLAAEDRHLGG